MSQEAALEQHLLDAIQQLPADLHDARGPAVAQAIITVQNIRVTTPWSDENRAVAEAVVSQALAKLKDLHARSKP